MPFLVCDPPAASEAVEYYTIAGLPGDPRVNKSTDPAFGMKHDISSLAPGAYSIRVSACNAWECSLPSPFAFTRPGKPSLPIGLRISL